jgi:uncharacterized protein (TIGR03118 family)
VIGAGCSESPSAERVVARTDIVSDLPGATVTDPTLVNAWGLAFNPMGAAWVNANGSGLSEVYNADGTRPIPAVTIPALPTATGPSSPTGLVFNSTTTNFMGDAFIFVTEDGTIAGWQPSDGTTAVMRVDSSSTGAVYKGVTLATDTSGATRLFAADFHNGRIDVFDSTYAPVMATGGFVDAALPAGFAPFNVREVGGALIVTYALQDAMAQDDVKGLGNGFVDLFDLNGVLLTRLISQGDLNSPWGIAVAPSSFGAAPNQLLIGNFGDGKIHAYTFDMTVPQQASAKPVGALHTTTNTELVIDGLWALDFGPNAGGFSPNLLYFTAGPAMEMHGVFGRLQSN